MCGPFYGAPMDRQTVYQGQILPETTLLQMAKDSMIGLAKLSAAMLGTSTIANGFATTPTAPASLQVVVAPGELYALTTIDATVWSSLAADTTHSVMKQGIALDSTTLTCSPPATSGQSINYLVEVAYQDLDATPVLLPYYNSANPSAPYSGQGNNGLTQNTVRKGAVAVQVKAGASAATGSQLTPAPDVGYAGLYVVTVAYGQTSITSANIARYSAAPLLPTGVVSAVQGGDMTYVVGTGSANAYAAAYAPAITALKDGLTLHSTAVAANTGASTFSPNGLTAKPILSLAHAALIGGELAANSRFSIQYSSTLDSWILISASGGNALAGRLINVQVFGATGTFSYTPTVGTRSIMVEAQGGGASAGGVASPATGQAAVSGGGSSGAYGKSYYQVSTLSIPVLITVGAGGAAPTAGANSGIAGGTSSFGSYLAAPGGGASVGCASQAAPIVSANGGTNPGPVGANIVGSPGQAGQNGVMISANSGYSGSGGSSVYGAGGNSRASANPGNPGAGYGGGGSGALQAAGGAALAGGAGTQGIVIIWEYA